MSEEDLPAVQDIGEGNAPVILPLLKDIKIVDEDDKVVRATLVEDLAGGFVSTRHFEKCEG